MTPDIAKIITLSSTVVWNSEPIQIQNIADRENVSPEFSWLPDRTQFLLSMADDHVTAILINYNGNGFFRWEVCYNLLIVFIFYENFSCANNLSLYSE